MTVDEYIDEIRRLTIAQFPDAASVAIFVSEQETNVTPNFSGGLDEFRSIQQINGEWCGRAKNENCECE